MRLGVGGRGRVVVKHSFSIWAICPGLAGAAAAKALTRFFISRAFSAVISSTPGKTTRFAEAIRAVAAFSLHAFFTGGSAARGLYLAL